MNRALKVFTVDLAKVLSNKPRDKVKTTDTITRAQLVSVLR